MANIAIIPARSGSKGLKDKNIKPLNGKPLMAYTIEAAKKSGLFNEIFVSTDSEEYAEIARNYGASVPFLRSDELSSDTASSWDAAAEALKKYEELGRPFDSLALLQPTSPLRTSDDIAAAYKLIDMKNANAVVGVCETDHSPMWCNTLPEDGSLENFINKELVVTPRQKLPKYFRINGAIYIVKTGYFANEKNIYKSKCYAYIMDKAHSIDIDDGMDFMFAELMIKNNFNSI